MQYKLRATETFTRTLRKHRRNAALLQALDKKFARLSTAPERVGGRLGGVLHGYRSTRLASHYRLLFSVDAASRTVYLEALDHRKDAYD